MGRTDQYGSARRLTRRAWWRAALLAPLPALLLACGGAASPTSVPAVANTPATSATATLPAARTATAAATASRPVGTVGTTATRAASPSATVTRGAVNYPDVIRVAIDSLAAETGVPRDQITVVRYEPQEWSDSSLGCPQPGRTYLQVITPGYRVLLLAGGRQYEYHTNQTGMAVRCSS